MGLQLFRRFLSIVLIWLKWLDDAWFGEFMVRIMKRLILMPLLLGLGLGGVVCAQDEEFDPTGAEAEAILPKQIRVQVEYIEISQADMVVLMYGPKKSGDDTKLRDALQKMVKAGTAKMVETQMVTSRSGEKATVESIKEFIYPTEYEPSEVPNEVNKNGDKTGDLVDELATPPTPTAFETRNLGSTLEVEPTLGEDGKIIDVRFAPELVYHVGNEVWSEWSNKTSKADVQMPIFYTLRVNTGVTLTAGKYFMVSAVSPKNEKGFPDFEKKILIFLKADVLTVGR